MRSLRSRSSRISTKADSVTVETGNCRTGWTTYAVGSAAVAGGDGGKAERERKADQTAARQNRDCNGNERQRRGRPPGRLTIRREINEDAEAEGYRHPRDQPSRRDFGEHPFRQQPPQPSGAVGKPAGNRRPARRRAASASQALARVRAFSFRAMGVAPPTLTQPGTTIAQLGVVARRTVVNECQLLPCGRFFLGLVLRPGVAQADGADKDQPLGLRRGVEAKIALALELHRHFRLGVG